MEILEESNINVLQENSSPQLDPETKLNVSKCITFFKKISVEPVLLCYFVPSVLSLLSAQNVYFDKVCRENLNYSKHVCDALVARNTDNYTSEERHVQSLVASVLSWKSVIQTALPCIVIIFAGAWSELHKKRKIFIILPLLGELIAYSSFLAVMYFFEHVNITILAMIEAIPQALSGGWFVMLLGIYSYIGDITTIENRTFRIGVVTTCMSLGVPFGTSLSGLLLVNLGYCGAFSVSIVLYSISLVYAVFVLHDVSGSERKTFIKKLDLYTSFFSLITLKNIWKFLRSEGSSKSRIKVAMILIMVIIIVGPKQGELTIQYMYMRYKFQMDALSYSFFSTFSMIIFFIGNTLSSVLLSATLKFEDTTIGIAASAGTVASSFVYVFATSQLALYSAPVLDIFNGSAYIAVRSMASKAVQSEDKGTLNSLFSLAESLTPVICSPIYASVYMVTLQFIPGATYFVSAGLAVLAVILFSLMHFQRDKRMTTE